MSSSYGQVLKDIEIGFLEGEKPVQEFLLKTFGVKTSNVGQKGQVAWDLEYGGLDTKVIKKLGLKSKPNRIEKRFVNKYGKTFEVKRDKASDRTGNMFYEVWSNIDVHSPGCINRSKADTIVLVRKSEFIFIDRGYFISWIMYNLYHDTELSRGWKKKTCRKIKNPKMKNSFVSPAVRGILIPLEDIKEEASIKVFKRTTK